MKEIFSYYKHISIGDMLPEMEVAYCLLSCFLIQQPIEIRNAYLSFQSSQALELQFRMSFKLKHFTICEMIITISKNEAGKKPCFSLN